MLSWLPRNLLGQDASPQESPVDIDCPHSILLTGLTPVSHSALGARTWCLTKFPFNIGRVTSKLKGDLRRCDLMVEDQEPYTVSRNHCAILWVPTLSGFFVQDLGSRLGTIVNGLRIGRQTSKNMAPLERGDNEVALGASDSPFRFSIRLPKSLG